ncbi:unnamed protein product [Ectocarpus sp. 12 AP-2014]
MRTPSPHYLDNAYRAPSPWERWGSRRDDISRANIEKTRQRARRAACRGDRQGGHAWLSSDERCSEHGTGGGSSEIAHVAYHTIIQHRNKKNYAPNRRVLPHKHTTHPASQKALCVNYFIKGIRLQDRLQLCALDPRT